MAAKVRVEGFTEAMPYDVPNYLADYAMRNTHVPVGFWRCVNHTQNCFFKESFIDELAHAAGTDAYEYRRSLLGKGRRAERLAVLLEAAAKAADWGRPLPPGFGRPLGPGAACRLVHRASSGAGADPVARSGSMVSIIAPIGSGSPGLA